jgi:hypothetical protein
MTDTIIKLFVSKVDTNISYSNRELQKILSDSYKELNKPSRSVVATDKPRKQRTKRERDENGEIIKKRPPSAYNIFIKDESAKIRVNNPGLDSKSVFKLAIDEWKKSKGQNKVEEPSEDTSDTDVALDNKQDVCSIKENTKEDVDETSKDEVDEPTAKTVVAKKSRKPKKVVNDDE